MIHGFPRFPWRFFLIGTMEMCTMIRAVRVQKHPHGPDPETFLPKRNGSDG